MGVSLLPGASDADSGLAGVSGHLAEARSHIPNPQTLNPYTPNPDNPQPQDLQQIWRLHLEQERWFKGLGFRGLRVLGLVKGFGFRV